SGDTQYRQTIVEQIEGWIEQNPFSIGIHWCSSLESSLRLISWAIVHSLIVLKDGEPGLFGIVKDSERLGKSIYEQAYFARHYLSRYSSANNHLIGELTGLWVACQVFDLGEKGREWAEFAQQELEQESKYQVHADGVGKEQAFYYHLWVLEYLFFAWLVSTRSGQSFSEEFVERILAMAKFLEDVSPNGGEPPQVGDADDGFVARFVTNWPDKPYRELLNAVKCCFDEAEMATNEKAFWYRAMQGESSGTDAVYALNRNYPVHYPHGGYAIMGGAGCHLVFDAGPLGYLGIAAHGHADALSFCLAVDSEWWIVDPGTYAYHSASEWRSYFRGTSAHNTIRVNQQDQSQIGGSFMWLAKANAWIDDFKEDNTSQFVRAHHDGYKTLDITHSREIRYSATDNQFEILDQLTGDQQKTQLAEIYFHFAPDVDIKPGADENSWIATWNGLEKQLLINTDPAWQFEITRGGTNPISGWYSPALETKVPACTLCGKADLNVSLSCRTLIDIQSLGNK
ncbi:MAG: alginate lyase family protein, partial [Thiotrichaceae bacterium]